MNAEAFGGYCSLLVESWLDPAGSLPDDPEELPILARMSKASWARYEKTIRSLFTSEGGRLFSPVVTEARDQAIKRSELGKQAAEVRWSDDRKEEPKSDADVKRKQSGGNAKEKEKVKEKEKENQSSCSSGGATGGGGGYPSEFEEFWLAYKGLGGKTALNKKASFQSWLKTLKRGATAEDILRGIRAYDAYLGHRERTGKTDAREFVPMPETWLNQDRWGAEYPEETVKAIVKDPVSGRDFYWKEVESESGPAMGRFWIEGGEKTDRRFNEDEWRKKRKAELGITE